ncbi:MAG TPA: IS30 family transposase [Candidatus Acidoferrum sp.]|jgi:IS30 family transposase|nr:IS30 family transposase [Candidatus Acidoferrum sp.]
MLKEGRPGLTEEQKVDMWRRWKAGYSIREICLALKRNSSPVYQQLAIRGGIAPSGHIRAVVLKMAEREEISRGLSSGESFRSIAGRLGRAPSTVSREVARHGGGARYRANHADYEASRSALRPKPCRLALNGALRKVVASKLALEWSPEQVSGWLRIRYPDDESMQISHETIYKSLFIQARGVLKKELIKHLRSGRRFRYARTSASAELRGKIPDTISIRERPAEAEDRAIPGHWEGDLLYGTKTSQIITLVERHSRYTALIKVADHTSENVVAALTRHVRTLPNSLRRSLTWDHGKEMTNHVNFSVATDVKVYFCDPSSPWQRGTNENTNGLLRQYFPKGADLSDVTQSQLNKVALRLNQRPRKTLGFKTPADKLRACVAPSD